MSSFLTKTKGFTPVIDVVADDVGLVPAVVYGVVFRYCEMKNGVCSASLQTIADKVGVSRRTALRHIKQLCDKGYLEDLTPDVTNRPHTYANTGKVIIEGLLVAREESESSIADVTESHPSQPAGVTESHSRSDRESLPGVTESHPKIHDTKEETTTVDPNGSTPAGVADDVVPSIPSLAPDTESSRLAFSKLHENYAAKGRRGPLKFPTLECKRKFDASAEQLGDDFEHMLILALEQGCTSVIRMTNYVAGCAKRIANDQAPRVTKDPAGHPGDEVVTEKGKTKVRLGD